MIQSWNPKTPKPQNPMVEKQNWSEYWVKIIDDKIGLGYWREWVYDLDFANVRPTYRCMKFMYCIYNYNL